MDVYFGPLGSDKRPVSPGGAKHLPSSIHRSNGAIANASPLRNAVSTVPMLRDPI
jgi:hypothetical protein